MLMLSSCKLSTPKNETKKNRANELNIVLHSTDLLAKQWTMQLPKKACIIIQQIIGEFEYARSTLTSVYSRLTFNYN